MMQRQAVIAGAGIAGLSAALALAQRDWHVIIVEQASELVEIGAGVQISPNGMRVLDTLGITSRLESSLFEPDAIEIRMGRSGRKILRLPMKGYAQKRWGARFIQLHRADLQNAFSQELKAFSQAEIVTGHKVTGYVREKGGASVYLENGNRIYGDLVIGADGIHSKIRAQMHGKDRARFTGNVAWRCVVPVDLLGDQSPPALGCIWAGQGRHAVTTRVRTGKEVNFVGIVEQESWNEEGWSIPGDPEQALAEFAGWHPCLQAVLEKSSEGLFRWALHDRPPLAVWSDGPVVLLGDAAHPMLPSMAQGAVQALEDTIILARLLEHEGDIADAIQRYFEVRKTRTQKIQARSAANLRLFHKRNWISQWASYAPLAAIGVLNNNLVQRQQDWIYKFNPLNDPL